MNRIMIFSDFAWPYCYFGLALIQKLREAGLIFELEWLPFELDPNVPAEGMDLYKVLPKEYVERSLEILSKMGKEFGINYNNKNAKFNTRLAHLCGFYALEKGKYDDYAKAVFIAYFEDGANVYDRDVLGKVAEKIGLDSKEMLDVVDLGKYDENLVKAKNLANDLGIQSVPTFIINNRYKIAGVRDYDSFKELIMDLFNRLDD